MIARESSKSSWRAGSAVARKNSGPFDACLWSGCQNEEQVQSHYPFGSFASRRRTPVEPPVRARCSESRLAGGYRLPLDAGGLALLGCRARYALARSCGKACLSPSSCVLQHAPPCLCLELIPSREVWAGGVAGRTTKEQKLPHKHSARGQRCNRRASRRPKRGPAIAARSLARARLPLSCDRCA